MSELHDSVDYSNSKFYYIGQTKDVIFYEYMDSKELFNKIKNNQIKFSEVNNKQNELLNKLSSIKSGKKTAEQKKWLIILKNLTVLEKGLLILLETLLKCYLMQNMMQKKGETKGKGLKMLTHK